MFLNKRELAAYIGVSRNTVYELISEDPTFPKPVLLTRNSVREQWLDAAIDAWALARMEAVNQKPKRGRAE